MKPQIEKAKRYNFQSAYKDYKDQVQDPVSWPVFSEVLKKYMHNLNRAIIVDQYEWKLPFHIGYIRISKRKKKPKSRYNGWIYWAWDRYANAHHLPKPSLWNFKPVEGKYGGNLIGEYGLAAHITACKNNPRKENYDVIRKTHKTFLVPFDEFVDSIK